jgi:NADPH:quinone reductase-like Zn-dependent oxidoreductase
MKASVISRYGGPNVLELRDMPDPAPGPGEVRVRVRATGLNFSDVMARQGLYPDAPKPPMVVGYEVAGEIDAVGSGVTQSRSGARVIALTRFGGQAQLVSVPESQALPMPDGMSFEEGAALPVVYVTAYHMLFHVGCLRPGDSVLVHMAAGGVGTAVLQLCRTVPGVTVFGTASPSKHAYLRELGCQHPIDYRSTDYAAEVRRITNGRGVDMVLDPLGGADWKKGYDLLKPAGRLIAYGFANMASGSTRNIVHVARQFFSMPRFSPMKLMDQNKTVAGVNLGHLWSETELLRKEMTALLELYRAGKIKPHIDVALPLDRMAEAHGRLESRQNVGKVVLLP